MMTIEQLLTSVELHDSMLRSLHVDYDGAVNLWIDIDEVWNKKLDSTICGIRLPSVYEIVNYKIDRVNIFGSIDCVEVNEYDCSAIAPDVATDAKTVMVDIELVAGGQLTLVCADQCEFLFKEAG